MNSPVGLVHHNHHHHTHTNFQLFQYRSNPALVAFESSPPPLQHTPLITTKKCILLGGLSDGLIPTPYTSLLERTCHSLGWSLVQPIISSSYLGFGNGSLARDTEEMGMLMEYLVCHHDAEKFALVGHSTGCQNIVHFLKYGDEDIIQRIKVCSRRVGITLSVSSFNLTTASPFKGRCVAGSCERS